jgi:threonine synthase
MYTLKCVECGTEYQDDLKLNPGCTHSKYYSHLSYIYPYEELSNSYKLFSDLNKWEQDILKLLPVDKFYGFSDLSFTPTLHLKNLGKTLGLENLYMKIESCNPTGSFKDRESMCVVSKAVANSVDKLIVVSSGNAAISSSFYAKQVGIPCRCYVSKGISGVKLKLLKMYADRIRLEEGDYEEVYRDIIDEFQNRDKIWNITPGYNVVREEGVKLISFEIYKQVGVPDYVVVPCGNGTLLYGVFKGFAELQAMNITNRIPRMIGVQIEGNDPLVKAYETQKKYVKLDRVQESIVDSSIVAKESFSAVKVKRAIEKSDGKLIAVSDDSVAESIKLLIKKEAIIPEPSSASVIAALKKFVSSIEDNMLKDKKIVSVLSAGGVKNIIQLSEIINRRNN